MNKQDLKDGMIVQYRNGTRRILINKQLRDKDFITHYNLCNYNDDLIDKNKSSEDLDIIKVYDWEHNLLWEREEKLLLTKDEKVILKNLPEEYKWIARDGDGNLWVYATEPEKKEFLWMGGSNLDVLHLFNHLFKFIKWEDEEAYEIKKLLKG